MTTLLANSLIGFENVKPKIVALTKKTTESQFEIGVILAELKDKMNSYEFAKGTWKKKSESPYAQAKLEWKTFINDDLPFGSVVANKFVQIGNDKGIKKYLDNVPFSFNSMYALVGMEDKKWKFYLKNGLTTKSTGAELNELKKMWKAKTDPKPVETDTTVDASKEQVKGLTGKEDVVISDEVKIGFIKSLADPVVEVKVSDTNITNEQIQALQKLIDDTVSQFFSTENVSGDFVVKSNPHILSDDVAIAA